VEGKADEPFGATVEKELQVALGRPATDFPKRLEWLTESLVGLPAFVDPQRTLNPEIKRLPYQLFAGIAATLIESKERNAKRAIFVVHEFRTTKTDDRKMRINAETLDSFLRLVLHDNAAPGETFRLEPGHLMRLPIPPRRVQPPLPTDIPLYIGKVRTDLLAARASTVMPI
jgi:hypothetical protein